MRYSLADYIVTIGNIDSDFGQEPLSIGGEESYLDSISINKTENLYETTGDATGGYVHKKNLSAIGTVTLTLNQLSDAASKLRRIFNIYYSQDIREGMTITVTDSEQHTVAKCIDCYVQNIPSQDFGQDVGTQAWVLTCGKITFDID